MGFIVNIYKGNTIPMSKYRIEGVKHMDYQKAYALLVETMSNAIDEIGKSKVISQEAENAVWMLKQALEEAEEMYLNSEE
jgi:hypothetical protein